MKEVSRKTYERKCQDGDWEAVFEPNSYGTAEVRDTATGKRFPVRVR